MAEQLFQIMRFQILSTSLLASTKGKLDEAYTYAWYTGVYPLFQASELHRPFGDEFVVSKEMIEGLSKWLDEAWLAGKVPTFYQLEDHVGWRYGDSQWDRSALIAACRYIFLSRLFDKPFWDTLLMSGAHPMEAAGIVDPFDPRADLWLH